MRFLKRSKTPSQSPTEGIKSNVSLRERLDEIEQATISHAQRYLVRRWSNFREVGQRALLWLIVVLVLAIGVIQQTKALDSYYKVEVPAVGGTYSEGVVGKVENFNPLFASSEAEASVSRLVFASLLQYDNSNGIVGDLASSWKVDESGRVYTVTLRTDARWHDGHLVQSDDVAYTIQMIQDEPTRSPLASSWKGVQVKAVDPQTVEFTLPAPFPPFPHSLTLGIIPRHVLEGIPSYQLRTALFNTAPEIGSGPFKFKESRKFQERHEVRLVANKEYFGGEVKPERFNIEAYQDYDAAVAAFANHEFSAMGGLQPRELTDFDEDQDVKLFNAPLMHEVFAFFKTSNPNFEDPKVRQALRAATDQKAISDALGGWVRPAHLPLLNGQVGYNAGLDVSLYNFAEAETLLQDAGWVKNEQGVRQKDGKPLELNLVASSSSEYPQVAAELQKQWQKLGITVRTSLVKPADFQQNVIIPHNYDVLLYELALGQDPDVYAYWHSSQAAERGLNLSEYRSRVADDSLEAGRTRIDSALRAAKYEAFLRQWISDAPAVALYQPIYGYVHRPSVSGLTERTLVNPVDRYYGITNWTAEQRQAVVTH